MSVFSAILIGLAMGVVFGFALEKSRVFEPGVIVGQMQLRNFTMLKIFLSAVATGLIVLAALHGADLIKLHPKATLLAADVVGGLLLGAGIALAGACPGTVFAQIGAGYRDARLTLFGGLAGALAFVYLQPALAPMLKIGDHGKLTLDAVMDLPFSLVALVFAAILIAGMVALENWRKWQDDHGEHFDGATPEVMGESRPNAVPGRPLKPQQA